MSQAIIAQAEMCAWEARTPLGARTLLACIRRLSKTLGGRVGPPDRVYPWGMESGLAHKQQSGIATETGR